MDGAYRTESSPEMDVDLASCDVVDAIVRLRKALADAEGRAEERVSTRDALRAAYDLVLTQWVLRAPAAASSPG